MEPKPGNDLASLQEVLESCPVASDFRMTPQRRVVFEVLKHRHDHPSASDLYRLVKEQMPTISLATVYNCLEAMTQYGLVKQVNMDREPSRYCANLREHAHFFCQVCGEVFDIETAKGATVEEAYAIPAGSQVDRFEVTIRGRCSRCRELPDAPHN